MFVSKRKCGPNKVGFLGKSSNDLQTTKRKSEVIREKMWVTETIFESLENNLLKWYGHVVRMDYITWRKRIMTWSPEGRRRRGRPDVKWEKKVESVMMQRHLTSDDAVNRQVWRLKTGNLWTTGKHDGWMDGWMDGWVDGCVGVWMDGWMDGWMCRRVDGRQMGRW
jgi:hypothetical protein